MAKCISEVQEALQKATRELNGLRRLPWTINQVTHLNKAVKELEAMWEAWRMVSPNMLKKLLRYHKYERNEPSSQLQAELIKNAYLPKKEFDELKAKLKKVMEW